MQGQSGLIVKADKRLFAGFERPKVIGYIGLQNILFARSVSDKRVQFDLNLHLDKAKRNPEYLDDKLTELLKFLLEHEERLRYSLQNILDKAQYFCNRRLMICVACTPYERNESWQIVVILHKGNIYLCKKDSEEIIRRKQNMSAKEKQFTSWGYKFKQYMLSDTPNTEPNPNVPVDETTKFSLVFMARVNKHTVVYKATMDGFRCDKASVTNPPPIELGANAVIDYLSDKEFIELKTNRRIEYSKQEKNFRIFKCKKWWCQSYLAGVDTILCGFRDDDGIVQELKVFNVQDLPKKSQRFWDPNVCLNFLDTFFTFTKRCLARKIIRTYGDKAMNNLQSLPTISMLFEWSPGMPVLVNNNYNHEDDQILPEWFIKSYGQ